jgi:hypothetical protein
MGSLHTSLPRPLYTMTGNSGFPFMLIRYRRFAPSISYTDYLLNDIKGVRYRRLHCSISEVNNLQYRISITGSAISRFHDYRCWTNTLRYRMLISYTISKVTLTLDIEGYVIHIRFDIGYDVALSQYSLRSRSSLCPGSITLASKSPSATCPGFLLNPALSFAQFYS